MSPHLFRSTMAQSSYISYALHGMFTQRFRAQATGTPTELGIRMGNNQNPYSARIAILVNDRQVYDHTYTGCVQRTSDWATVFPIPDLCCTITEGDWVIFTVTPSPGVGMEPIFSTDPEVPCSGLAGYGDVACRFYMTGIMKRSMTAPYGILEAMMEAVFGRCDPWLMTAKI